MSIFNVPPTAPWTAVAHKSADQYLLEILVRETVPTGTDSPAFKTLVKLYPLIHRWAGQYLKAATPSGSYAKGTAIRSGTDIDIFISLRHDTPFTLEQIYWRLFQFLQENGYTPRPQNVSINIIVDGQSVDLVPARRQDALSNDHSLYLRKRQSWQKTNVQRHINLVHAGKRIPETKLTKLWRNQWGFDFPSFYLEMSVIQAMRYLPNVALSKRMVKVMEYLRDDFTTARFADPANQNNIISDDLNATERNIIKAAAERALAGRWLEFVK